jgi:hypothetical protein
MHNVGTKQQEFCMTPPQQPAVVQALQQTVMELMQARLEWQVRAIELAQRVAELEESAKPVPTPE